MKFEIIEKCEEQDFYLRDTFLTPSLVSNIQQEIISVVSANLKAQKSRRLKVFSEKLPFIKTFDNKGINGIAGLISLNRGKDKPVPIVFKINVAIDNVIDHEETVAKSLTKLRDYCPHFCYLYNSFVMPISRNYIDSERADDLESDEEIEWEEGWVRSSIWENEADTLTSKILLYEYVSDMSLYHLCKISSRDGDMQTPLSQVLMILAGLEMAQKATKFTHYDLHMDNILIRPCQPNSMFVYIFQDDTYSIVPTHGYYPVIIDYGNSFSADLEGKKIRSSTANYQNGVQPSVFDPMGDVHHFCLSTIGYLESKDEKWRNVVAMLFYYLGHIPLWRNKGWKRLPGNLMKGLIEEWESVCPDVLYSALWNDFYVQIMEIIANLVDCPVKATEVENREERIKQFGFLISQLQIIDDMEDLVNDKDTLVVLKALVDTINLKLSDKEEVSHFKNAIASYVKPPKEFKVKECMKALRDLIPVIQSGYYSAISVNSTFLNDVYGKTEMKSPVDMMRWLQSFVSDRFEPNAETVMYVWDAKQGKSKSIVMGEMAERVRGLRWKESVIEIIRKEKII